MTKTFAGGRGPRHEVRWRGESREVRGRIRVLRTVAAALLRPVLLVALLAVSLYGAGAGPPAPREFFGHAMGADRKLVAWDRVVAYFEALDQASDRVQTAVIGQSVEGRPLIAATISAPETLRDLGRYQMIQQRLADPRDLAPAEAERLIAAGKAVVMITCSIHATEVGSTQTAIEFAHRLATADEPGTREILDNVIFLLAPSLNPDGVEIVRQWYEKTLGTPFEGTSPPELYHKYVGHDNNRDWYIFSQPETRATIEKLHNVWHPQIVYDVHQQGPWASRMFVPPWLDPSDPNIDPLLVQLCNMIGMGMAADLTMAGKTGVVVNASYDFWTPARHYQAYHAGMRILTESASAKLATPLTVDLNQIRQSDRGYNPRERSWNYVEPWLGGEWRLRDIVDYQLIAWDSCLRQAARRRADLLRSFYRLGARAAGRQKPYAFVVPRLQHDPGSARKMLETLAFGMVEIEEAREPFRAAGRDYPAGSYVVRMQQPYSSWAKTLLERQQYPDLREYPGGPPQRPYDVTAHSLPLLMGAEVDVAAAPFEAALRRTSEFPFTLAGDAPAEGGWAATDIDSWKEVNRLWRQGAAVWRDATSGDFYAKRPPSRRAFPVRPPRIGVYRGFVPNMDEGWTRWTLEQFGFAYRSLTNPEIHQGGLPVRFDVIVFPDQSASSIANGYGDGAMPPEYTGGLGAHEVAALKAFAARGGTLVFLNQSAEFALDRLVAGAENTLEGVSNTQFYCPGSQLNVLLEPHPLTYGMPREAAVWFQRSPAFAPDKPADAVVVARYPESAVLASGWLLGEKLVTGQSPLLDVPLGKGHVILFGMRPQYRGQSYQSFKLFFNALVRHAAPERAAERISRPGRALVGRPRRSAGSAAPPARGLRPRS